MSPSSLRNSLRPDLQNDAFSVRAEHGVFGRRLELQAVHQSAAASLVKLFGPFGPFDDQQAAKRVPVWLESGQQLPQWPDGSNHQGVKTRVLEQFFRPERKDRNLQPQLLDD